MSGTVTRLVPLTCGYMTLPLAFFLDGEPGKITFPATAYLIDHPDGLTLFDAGLGPRFIRAEGTERTGMVDIERSGAIDARLAEIDVDATAITRIVNSHLHTDHAGGNALVPNAHVVVQRAEHDFAYADDGGAYSRAEFDTGQEFELVEGTHDLFGDGSVVLSPTPGHTPGHQSARVRTARGEVVLAGDACNLRRALDEMHLPDHAWDMDQYRASLEQFSRWRAGGAQIFYSHDPEFWATLRPGTDWAATADVNLQGDQR